MTSASTRLLLICTLNLLISSSGITGGNDAYVISQKGYVQTLPAYQSWKIDGSRNFAELSNLLYAYAPVSREIGLTIRNSQALVDGDQLEGMSGWTDTQLGLSYHLRKYNLVLNIGLNLPTGKSKLDSIQLVTSQFISNNLFDLKVPAFGQGLHVSPGVMWAGQLTEKLVVGLGASYLYRAEFEPFESGNTYKPGDELLLTAGIDYQFSSVISLAADIVFTSAQTDRINGRDVFEAGSRTLVVLSYRQTFGFNELRLEGRYRNRARSEFVVGQLHEQSIPDQIEIDAQFDARIGRRMKFGAFMALRRYQEAVAAFSDITLFVIGIKPSFRIGRSISFPIELLYLSTWFAHSTDIIGFHASAGLVYEF